MKNYIAFLIVLFCCKISDAQPRWQWGRTTPPSENSERVTCASTADGCSNMYIAMTSYTDSTVFGSLSVSNPDPHLQTIIVKIDSNGNYVWARGTRAGGCQAMKMVADKTGNLYVLILLFDSVCTIDTFTFHNSAHGAYGLIKFSPSGDVLWASCVTVHQYMSLMAGAIGTDDAGDLYFAGNFSLPTITIGSTTLHNTTDTGNVYDVFIAKYDPAGSVIWAKSFGGADDDYIVDVAVTPDGTFYMPGAFWSSSLSIGNDTLIDSFFTGTWRNSIGFLAKFDSSGNATWAEALKPHVYLTNMQLSKTEQLYLTGWYDSTINLDTFRLADLDSHANALIVSYDSSGALAWANSGEGYVTNRGSTVALDSCGNVWLAGGSNFDTISFSGHRLALPDTSIDPAFIVRYDANGNYDTSFALPSGGGDDNYIGINTDNQGNFYLAGSFHMALPLGPDTLTNTTYQKNIFAAKFKYGTPDCGSLHPIVHSTGASYSLSAYPNPARDKIILSLDEKIAKVTVSNFTGNVIYSATNDSKSIEIDATNYPPGVYVVKVNGVIAKKIIKE